MGCIKTLGRRLHTPAPISVPKAAIVGDYPCISDRVMYINAFFSYKY